MKVRIQSAYSAKLPSTNRDAKGRYLKRLGGLNCPLNKGLGSLKKNVRRRRNFSKSFSNRAGSICSDSEVSQDSINFDEDEILSENEEKDGDCEDLPTAERPYSKILSFHYHTRPAGAENSKENPAAAAACHSKTTRWSRVSAELKQVVMRRSCCQDRHCHRPHCRPLKTHNNQTLLYGTGSKNLSFVKQQLADKVLQSGKVNEVVHVFSCAQLGSYTRPSAPIRQHYYSSPAAQSHSHRRSPAVTDFGSIPDLIPIPRTLNDFDMTLFGNLDEEPYAVEWEYVEELLRKEKSQEDDRLSSDRKKSEVRSKTSHILSACSI